MPTIRLKTLTLLVGLSITGCTTTRNLTMYEKTNVQCYDRSSQPFTFAVDSHHHFRSFTGDGLPFSTLNNYFTKLGIVFVNIYGIGQTLPIDSTCNYIADCPGTSVRPSITNDFINAANSLEFISKDVHLTLSMSFADLANPEQIVQKMALLDSEYPNQFKWMGEVNLVKQALFKNQHTATPIEKIEQWHDFMTILQQRNMPLSIHSDLGNDANPTQYRYLMDEVLKRYPHNKIVWVHMGLSRELSKMDPKQHIDIMKSYLDNNPNLMLDISWRILNEYYFTAPQSRDLYVAFFNNYSTRILPGSDFIASNKKTLSHYKSTVEANSAINQYLNDEAFRNIALGQNYIDLLGLDYRAPNTCEDSE